MMELPIEEPGLSEHDAATGQHDVAAAAELRSAKRNRFRAGMVFGVVVTIAVVLLIVQNGESAQFDWITFHFKSPLWILLTLTATAGAIVWDLIKVGWRRGRRQRRDEKSALVGTRESR